VGVIGQAAGTVTINLTADGSVVGAGQAPLTIAAGLTAAGWVGRSTGASTAVTITLDAAGVMTGDTAPTPDNTWIVRAENTTATLPAETNAFAVIESATVAARGETNIHVVKAESNLLEVQ
jgi:hypothetical protein